MTTMAMIPSPSYIAGETVIAVHWTGSDILEQEVVAGLAVGVVCAQILITVVILAPLLDKVQMNVEMGHVDSSEDALGVADDVLAVSITRHLQLQSSAIVISAQCPEMCLVHPLDPSSCITF